MKIFWQIVRLSAWGLSPAAALRSPTRFMVWAATVLAGIGAVWEACTSKGGAHALTLFGWIALTLIFTVICEAVAEGLAREQTSSLKKTRDSLKALKIASVDPKAATEEISASELKAGDLFIVRAGDIIPADGDAVLGIATVDESALTGESAPVIREGHSEHSAVTAGTKVLSDWIICSVTAVAGESFIDKMITMVEGAKRQRTPTEEAVDTILTMLTGLFFVVAFSLWAWSQAWSLTLDLKSPIGLLETLAIFLCLAPTTIGALLPVVGISGMLRLIKANVIAKSGQAVEAAGNVDIMLMDKTGTITLGDRQARAFYPVGGINEKVFAADAQLASLADSTPEGRSIVVYAKDTYGIRTPERAPTDLTFIDFSAQTKMSGVDLPGRQLRKGAGKAVEQWLKNQNLPYPDEARTLVNRIASEGGTPLVVADNKGVLGVIALRDVIKGGLKERFAQLRAMGISTMMITGDNALTAAAVAAEAGVDKFEAEATPEKKLSLIRQLQASGHTVAMTGDGTNDAPALAQADVALAMNSGTQPAKEAGNLIDLDSNPTKLIEVVRIGKQNLITIGALATFSLANDIAKFFTLVPALLSGLFPQLKALDLLHFASPMQALVAALVFNAVIIPLLLPLSLIGTPFKPVSAASLLRRHLVIYGLGGAAFPFILMKGLQFLIH